MDPIELQQLVSMLQARETMGVPPGRFGPGQSSQASPVDQIPGIMPQVQQPDDMMDPLRRKFMSGGAMDLRNLVAALPTGTGAMSGLNAMRGMGAGARPAAPMGAADQMFDMSRAAPMMAPQAQAGRGLPAILGLLGGVGGVGGYGAYEMSKAMDERQKRLEEILKNQR